MIKFQSFKETVSELIKTFQEKDVALAVHSVTEMHLRDILPLRTFQDFQICINLELMVTANDVNGVKPNFCLFKYKNWRICEFIIEIAYNKIEDERRREIIACFHQDNELQEAFLFNFEEDRLYRFTRQPDDSFIEEENSYSRRFEKDIRYFFGTSLELLESLLSDIVKCMSLPRKERDKVKKVYEQEAEYLRKYIERERCEQYALCNNLNNIPITEDAHAWYNKMIYDDLLTLISSNKDFKTCLLYANAPVYSDDNGTLRSDIVYFKSVDKPKEGNCPTFKYALWVAEIVGEEGLEIAQQKIDNILKKVVTIEEAFLYDPKTKKWMRYSRKKDNSVMIEEKSYSRYFCKYMGIILQR